MSGTEPGGNPWTADRGRLLLQIARESVTEALGLCAAGSYAEPWLDESGACFVTLMRHGDVLIQRGTNHAWANRSDRIARVCFVLNGATPA